MSVLDIDKLMSNQSEDKILIKEFIMKNYYTDDWGRLNIQQVNGEYIVDFDWSLHYIGTGSQQLTNGLFRFGKVFTFNCAYCKELTSLEGGPEECDWFVCNYCDGLTSLKGAPRKCRKFYCSNCANLTSLKGAPRKCITFDCSCCENLTSLEGASQDYVLFYHINCTGLK